MNAWLTVLKQALQAKRYVLYLMGVWLVGGTAITAALWPECTYPFEEVEGMGVRLFGFLLVTAGVGVWGALVNGLDLQLSSNAVQLVPGLRRAAIIVATLSWLVVTTGLALQTCVYGVPFSLIFPCLLVGIAITISRTPRVRMYAAVPLMLLLSAPVFGDHFLMLAGTAPVPTWVAWIAAVFAIATGGTIIVTEFARGAEAHGVLYSRVVRQQLASNGERDMRAQGMWDSILKRPGIFQWGFDRMLRAPSPERRLLAGLGRTFHWSQAAVGGALQAAPFCLIIYVASRALGEAYGARDQSGVDLVLLNAAALAFLYSIQLADNRMRELWARRNEQALLLIVPGAPTGSNINRWLMQSLVLQHAIAIVAALWFVTAAAFVLQLPLESTLKVTSAPLAASLLVTPALLRDYASMRQPRRLQYTVYAGILIIPLYAAVLFRRGIDPMIVISAAFLLSAVLAVWRYARLADAPTAFPVGRLAA